MAFPKELILLGILGVALLLSIIGVVIPRWVEGHSQGYEVNAGLWNACFKSSSTTKCQSISDPTSRLIGIRAMEILGILFTLGALVCVILRMLVMKGSAILRKAIGLAIPAGLMMLIGCITYATSNDKVASNLSAGFALCIVAGVLAIVGGMLQDLIKENQTDNSRLIPA